MANIDKPLTAKSLVQGAVTLLSLPDIYQQLEAMIADPRFTALDMGEVISKDPALSTRLLKLVNSSFYGFQARIDTISRAITIVGVDDLKSLVLATSVVDAFNQISSDLVDMTDFWLQSIQCGVIARSLAKKNAVLHSERLFLAGLLHNIGSLVLYQKLPEVSEKILKLADYNAALVPGIEQALMGFTFADVGGELVRAWSLPGALHEAVAYQLTPEMALAHRLDAQILHIASIFSRPLVHDEYSAMALWEAIPQERRTVVRLESIELLPLLQQAESDVGQFYELLVSAKKCY